MRVGIFTAMLIALCMSPSAAFTADTDVVFDEKRAFMRHTGSYICDDSLYFEACFERNVAVASYCQPSGKTGGPRPVACALETVFACIIGKDGIDPEACRRIAGAPDPDCAPKSLMGVWYKVFAVYGLDRPGAWPSVLPSLSEQHRYARIVFNTGFCEKKGYCGQLGGYLFSDVVKIGDEWRFDDANRQAWRHDPYMNRLLCEERT